MSADEHDPILTECESLATEAKRAARRLAHAPPGAKDAWLRDCATRLVAAESELLAANAQDVAAAPGYGLNAAAIDRLTLTPARVRAMAVGLRQVADLPDPVGEVREGRVRPNGLQVLKVGAPLGVIFFLYESRPNVTADAASLCVKAGSAVILRGGKEARHTNASLYELIAGRLEAHGLPRGAVQLVRTADRAAVGHLLAMPERIDLCIPRGGESLIRRVAAEAKMPVLKHYQGNCHVYVDAGADLDMAARVAANAKCQRPGTCNAAETLLVHAAVAAEFLPRLPAVMPGVEFRCCPEALKHIIGVAATTADYADEFLDLILAVKVVKSLDEAMTHIAEFGSGHTEAILTRDLESARRFQAEVDSAAVVVNASTRFNDGFELGLGAEIGISTDKFHARGPCGLRELTTTKYLVTGTGQVRG